ncbi:AI-2E family transporter [Nonomuraea sp. NPDC049725]|uniref:AI-2E family transporter n=1 Tax=Nonomuraea sp. NPDC049725 TaxID=3154508 RepID=UPI003448CA20
MIKPGRAARTDRPRPVRVVLSPANVARAGLALAVLVAAAFFLHFVLTDAGWLVVLVVLAWFVSLAMEPGVRRLSRWMPRGRATMVMMVALILAALIFLALFGNLFLEQAAQLLRHLPTVAEAVISWINARLGTQYRVHDILASIHLTPQQAAEYAQGVLGGVLSLLGAVTKTVFNLITILLLAFYLSADGPRLRHWIARLLPRRPQQLFGRVWDLSIEKTGGYVSARLILATINGCLSAAVFLLIGMPSWLALGVWTGVVAQFVPTIGTYISIALPAVVGFASPQPWVGAVALGWAILYQQVENLTLEPRISARSVDLHPAVSFTAVLLGAALFGPVGALLSIPVVAMLFALVDTYAATRPEPVQEMATGG